MTDYSDLIGQTYGANNPALPTTVGNIDEDPDKAQRAIDLSKATGVAPTSIYGDLEEFERQHKAVLASDIVANNPHLSDYVQSNPMAPRISNDDYGQLDTVSSKVSAMSLPMRMLRAPEALANALFPGDPTKHFTEGGRLGSWIQQEDLKDHPVASAIVAGLGTPIELAFRGLGGVICTGVEAAEHAATAVGGEAFGRDIAAMTEAEAFGMSGRHGLHGPEADPAARIRPYIENGREPLPTILPEYDDFRAKQNADDVDALKEATSEAQSSLTRDRSPEMFRSFIAQHTDAEIGIGGDAVAALYGDKVPHPDDGLLGWVPGIEDKLNLARETGTDVSVPLADWLTHAEPEMMQALHDDLRVRPGGITANEVKAEAERKQDIADISERIKSAAITVQGKTYEGQIHGDALQKYLDENPEHTDQTFPHGDYAEGYTTTSGRFVDREEGAKIAKAQDQLKPLSTLSAGESQIKSYDDVKTLMAEDLLPSKLKPINPNPEPIPEDVPSLRAATALEPLFSVGDRKLELQRLTRAKTGRDVAEAEGTDWDTLNPTEQNSYNNSAHDINVNDRWSPAQGFHDFSLNDEQGRPVGTLNISEQKGGKQLYVDMVNGIGGLGPRDFGPALMRDLLRQLKQEFPEAESITGHRVSGAREKAGTFMAASASPVVKLDRLDEAGFQKLLEDTGHWETYSPNIQGYIKPDAMRSAEDRQLVNIVNDELDRIVPKKVAIQGADNIKAQSKGIEGQNADEDIKVGGTYIRYKETYPIILYALDSENALGAARHEAIHHLRNYGFFKPDEWETLTNEALAGGWLSKYNIDRRYPTAKPDLKLEEAVAEAYMDWSRGQDALRDRAAQIAQVPSPLDAIFQKMKDFFDGIKAKVSALFGKNATWEDVFKRVDTGEVGGREGTEPLDPRAFNEKLDIEQFRKAANENESADPGYEKFVRNLDRQAEEILALRNKPSLSEFEQKRLAKLEEEWQGADKPENHVPFDQRTEKGIATSLEPRLSVEPPEPTSRVFERAAALGMTVDQFKAYDRLMQERHEKDIAAAQKRIDDFQRKTQTKEWKDNRRELRQEISKEIHQRPDVAADLFFATGELYGQKIASGYKIDSDQLTPEQKAAIPKDYQARGGLNPDDVANIFGYGSGDAMLQRLAEYNAAKKASGLGAKDFVARVTDAEADRQMRIKYGVLEDNIVDSVKEQVASETQLDILHEETMKLGMDIGQAPLDKGSIISRLRDYHSKETLGSFSSDQYMRAAGKSGKAAELALLKDDPQEAFRAKQQQYYATVMANEAMKTEKALGQFDKLAKRFSKREIATVDQEYTNFIHDILMRVGKPVRRSIQDLETEIAAGEYKSLPEFVQGKETHGLREVPVADILLDPNFRKKFEDLTVDEFNATNDSIKTLLKNGRDEKKINKAGEAFDLNEVKQQMIDQLASTTLVPKKYDAKGKRTDTWLPKLARSFSMNIMQLETLFNRFDEGDAHGPFQQFIMRDLADAASNEGVLRKKYAAMVRGLDDSADLKKSVDNTIFKVPDSDQLMKFNRENLRAVLLNMGNESNMSKLARGYGIEPQAVWNWVNKHATKEDWDWAQKMGDVFAEIKKEADAMYRNLSGVAPASLEIKPVQTLHGEYPGWYYPIINHPEFEGKSKKLMGPNALEGEGFVRATTPSGYTKGRTGYAGPMALDLDALPGRMTQMLHDIAMRPAVINASKMFYDKDFRGAISKYYNTEARDMLIPYLKSVANSANYIPKNQKDLANLSEFARQNMINTLVGLNPGTVLKHGPTAAIQSLQEVGVTHFLKAIKGLFSVNESTGENNWQFAMKTFDELQLRHRNYEETLGGAMNEIAPQGQFMSLRQTVQKFASAPVALSDLLSAVPMALAQYSKSMEEGLSHGDAVAMANRAVRRAHGSMAITNRSAIQRVGPLAQWLVSVYGFFNHIANRQYELAWKSGDAVGLAKDGEYKEAMSRVPEITAKLFAYVIAPAVIEQMVTPLEGSDKDSWGWKAAKSIAFTLGASWPVVRDIVSGLTGGRDPSVGLLTTAGKSITDVGRDLAKDRPFSKEHAGKVIRDGSVLLGMGTGVVPGQAGKTAQFAQGVHAGTEHPKGPWGWMVGARFGMLKNHSGTFQDYMRHH
jgi:hypothetical protein